MQPSRFAQFVVVALILLFVGTIGVQAMDSSNAGAFLPQQGDGITVTVPSASTSETLMGT